LNKGDIMKKFHFNLQKLLDYKETLKNNEKNALAMLQAKKAEIEGRIVSLENQIRETQEQMRSKAVRGTTINEIRGQAFKIEQAKSEIKMLALELESLELKIQKQLEVVVKLSQETAELEKIKEKKWEEYLEEIRKADELIISEYLSSKLARQAI